MTHRPPPAASGRYLSEDERIRIADGIRAGKSARTIASELGRAVSTVARELTRNHDNVNDSYRPHQAHARMLARRPRSHPRRLAHSRPLEGDLVVGRYNRSAIGTLVERSTLAGISHTRRCERPCPATTLSFFARWVDYVGFTDETPARAHLSERGIPNDHH